MEVLQGKHNMKFNSFLVMLEESTSEEWADKIPANFREVHSKKSVQTRKGLIHLRLKELLDQGCRAIRNGAKVNQAAR